MIWAGLAAINTGIKAVAYNESIYGRLLGMQLSCRQSPGLWFYVLSHSSW